MKLYLFGTTISYKLHNISEIMTMYPVFPDYQKNFKKHFKIKQLFWHLVSLDCKDASNTICQTLAFLLVISWKHCLFFTDNVWQFELKWSENLAEGCFPNFPGLSSKALLLAFPWENKQHILQSHPFSTEEK